MLRDIKKRVERFMRPKYYDNCVEASYATASIRQFFGVSAYTVKSAPGGRIYAQFTYFGFICFVFWYFLYFFCVYRIYVSDQTVLRSLYDTKLRRYGDEVERMVTTIYVVYTMWKLPFDVHLDVHYMQLLVDIDKVIESLGEPLNFSKYARLSYARTFFIIVTSGAAAMVTWLSLSNLNTAIPLEKVFQVLYSDALTLVMTSRYCGYLYFLTRRYKILNEILASIDAPKTRNMVVAVRGKNGGWIPNMRQYQEEYTSGKLRTCGKIYGMLYDGTERANIKFGSSLALTLIMCLIFIVLYLFYFLEATASGLFLDVQRYIDYLMYVIWQIFFALGVICLNIYFSVNTVNEAKLTSLVIHKIINSEVNPLVRTEAVHLSLQIMHQLPLFTARGFCKLDYMLLVDGLRTVVTLLVIILQFVSR